MAEGTESQDLEELKKMRREVEEYSDFLRNIITPLEELTKKHEEEIQQIRSTTKQKMQKAQSDHKAKIADLEQRREDLQSSINNIKKENDSLEKRCLPVCLLECLLGCLLR